MTATKPLRGEARVALARHLKSRYQSGASIEQLAEETGRSQSNIVDLLHLARTRLRRPPAPARKPRKPRVIVKRSRFRKRGTPAAPTGPLNKTQLAEVVAADLGIPAAEGGRVLEAVFDAIVRTNAAGHDVTITNFGTFRAVEDPARKARNPQTGQPVDIPPRPTVRLRVSPRLAEILRARDTAASIAKLPRP
ncbi:HU family DNA-binding protein [Streptomyces aquilus]|uniref:HU family DNA-binding protein n=1 Tax=Streptomyces aquilus TaxID=2548456 RepID=UPI0037D147CA